MKITSLEYEKIKCFKKVDKFSLSDTINVFIGENNSGKSTLLKSILSLVDYKHMPPQSVTRGQKGGRMNFGIKNHSFSMPYEFIEVLFNERNNSYEIKGLLKDKKSGSEVRLNNRNEFANYIVPFLASRKVSKYSGSLDEGNILKLTTDLSTLPLKVDKLLTYPHDQLFVDTCKEILGFEITVKTIGREKVIIHKINEYDFVLLTEMGEGVPSIIGLVANLCLSENKIILIEELENDLHPRALKSLLNLVIKKSLSNQFLISTHSNIVLRNLGAESSTSCFEISNSYFNQENVPEFGLSTINLIDDTPASRMNILNRMGYELYDTYLWKAWLFIEESSAERVIRDYFIPWFTPDLQLSLRTFSTNSVGNMINRIKDFKNLMVFIHLEPIYKNKTWVLIDEGKDESIILSKLKGTFSTWNTENFKQLDKHDFEDYYPTQFKLKSDEIKSIGKGSKEERLRRMELKKKLLNNVIVWIDKNTELAKEHFRVEASEIISTLLEIDENIKNSH